MALIATSDDDQWTVDTGRHHAQGDGLSVPGERLEAVHGVQVAQRPWDERGKSSDG